MTMDSAASELPQVEPRIGATSKVSRWEIATLAGLLLLAAVARLARPGLTEFKADEGRLLTAALAMADGEFAVRGISSSVGFPNAPMSVWLYAIPLVFWPHPYAATLFTGALSLAAVAGVYWLARRYRGRSAAAIAALMLAVSPWAIVFSRKIWAQDLLPLFAVGWAIGAALAFVEGRRAFIVLHLLCLAIAVQLHPAAIALVPATILLLIIFRRQVDWRYLLLGGVLAALMAAPFLWYLWGRWRAEGSLPFSTGQQVGEVSFDSLRLAFEIAIGVGLRPLAGEGYTGLPGEAAVRLLWLAAILAGIVWTVMQIIQRRKTPAASVGAVALLWFLSPALFFLWHRTPVYVHYFIVALPAAYLMAGFALGRAIDGLQPGGRAVAWVAVVLLAGLQLAAWSNLMAAIARDPTAGGFGLPLGAKLAAADAARTAMDDVGAAEVLLVGDGSDPEQDDFPAEFRALLHGEPLRYADINAEAVFPAAAAVILIDREMVDGPTSVRDVYLAAGAPTFGESYTVLTLPPEVAPRADVELAEAALLANFVKISGHNAPRFVPGGALWDVLWRPADNPDRADYHLFNHLIDGTGARIAQADAAVFSGAQWRPGDVVISRFLLPLSETPAPPLTIRVGMYHYPSLEAVPVLDEAANPAADAVDFSLKE
jgi:4-amino-4-deoxy-L-arabinose transferase-like glycosyltransferase